MKVTKYLCILLLSFSFLNCSTDDISSEEITISTSSERQSNIAPCLVKTLFAGQNIEVGTVSVYHNKLNIIIRYETVHGWEIKETHLSVGNDGEDSFPLTGSGNPKVGKFEYSSEHDQMVTSVQYEISKDQLADYFYFAAHAVVENTLGNIESAWADGIDFSGNNWAMYVKAKLADCDAVAGYGINPIK